MDGDAIIKIVNGERNSEAYLISQEYTYEALTNLITEMGSAGAPPFDVEFIETFGVEGKYDIYVETKDLMGSNEVLSKMINNFPKNKSIKITVHSTSEQDEFGGGGKYNKTYKKRSKSKSRKRNTRKRNTRKRNTRKRNTRKRNTRK